MTSYRADIDGLRALAVLAVIFYHAYPQAVPGGFVGVDIFFVISGFLITGIINSDLAAGRFELAAFYARRVRRLFPALLLVMAACLAYGLLVLLPIEMASLGQQADAAALFAANLLFWQQAGYFDTAAVSKPLLHLWSLGVEEQFYAVWPLMLRFLWRRRIGRLQVTLAATMLSFAVNLFQSYTDPTADFYAPFGRFWEFGAGALVALHGAPVQRRAGDSWAYLGIFLVLAAAFAFDATARYPGWRAAVPVAGAALLIAAGPTARINSVVLANRPAVILGLISYPLYLWHWPLLSFATILRLGRHPTPLMAGGLLAASIVLAWLTTRCVETRLRHPRHPRLTTRMLLAGMAAIGLMGAASWRTQGFASRFSHLPGIDIARINAAIGDGIFARTPAMSVKQLGLVTVSSIPASAPDAADDAILLTGDSLVYQYAPRVEALFRAHNLRRPVYFVVGPSCSPIPGVARHGSFAACDAMPRIVAETVAGKPIRTVVIGAFWAGFAGADLTVSRGGATLKLDSASAEQMMYANLQEDVTALIKGGHRVVLLLSSPISERFDPRHMITRSLTGFAVDPNVFSPVPLAELHAATADADRRLTEVAGASVISPYPDVCGAGPGCSPFFDGVDIKFADEKHLRPDFVRDHIRFLDAVLNER